MDFKKVLFKTNEIDVEKSLPDAVIYCGKEGKILWVDDKSTEVFETPKMHLLTSNINGFVENALNMIRNAIETEKPVIVKGNEREVYYEMAAKEINDGYVTSFRPLTENSGTNILPEESVDTPVNRDKNNFLIKLANDFKSPLQSIIGFAQAMADGLGGSMSEQQEKYIKIIKKNSMDLMYFTGKLLELSQTETALKAPLNKTFDLVNLINSVIRYNEQLYKDKELRWQIDVEEGIKNTIVSDQNIMRNILQNTFEVILKAVEMGEVSVTISEPSPEYISNKGLIEGRYVQISISSSSLLFSESDLECLFDPYKIVDTANRKNLLRAMTLACVKNLVQSLNGAVWVESKILKNTCFNILIPQ